jgi:hypothetical protein
VLYVAGPGSCVTQSRSLTVKPISTPQSVNTMDLA